MQESFHMCSSCCTALDHRTITALNATELANNAGKLSSHFECCKPCCPYFGWRVGSISTSTVVRVRIALNLTPLVGRRNFACAVTTALLRSCQGKVLRRVLPFGSIQLMPLVKIAILLHQASQLCSLLSWMVMAVGRPRNLP